MQLLIIASSLTNLAFWAQGQTVQTHSLKFYLVQALSWTTFRVLVAKKVSSLVQRCFSSLHNLHADQLCVLVQCFERVRLAPIVFICAGRIKSKAIA